MGPRNKHPNILILKSDVYSLNVVASRPTNYLNKIKK
jgi:hypothetical protein